MFRDVSLVNTNTHILHPAHAWHPPLPSSHPETWSNPDLSPPHWPWFYTTRHRQGPPSTLIPRRPKSRVAYSQQSEDRSQPANSFLSNKWQQPSPPSSLAAVKGWAADARRVNKLMGCSMGKKKKCVAACHTPLTWLHTTYTPGYRYNE